MWKPTEATAAATTTTGREKLDQKGQTILFQPTQQGQQANMIWCEGAKAYLAAFFFYLLHSVLLERT
jgi:hypothetical protein